MIKRLQRSGRISGADMAKQAIYLEEAQRQYVRRGMTLDAIVGMLGDKISRKTLYNWKEEYRWDDKRKEFLAESKSDYEELLEIYRTCRDRAKANPSPKNLLALSRARAVLADEDAIKLIKDEKEEGTKELTGDIVSKIEKDLGIV